MIERMGWWDWFEGLNFFENVVGKLLNIRLFVNEWYLGVLMWGMLMIMLRNGCWWGGMWWWRWVIWCLVWKCRGNGLKFGNNDVGVRIIIDDVVV